MRRRWIWIFGLPFLGAATAAGCGNSSRDSLVGSTTGQNTGGASDASTPSLGSGGRPATTRCANSLDCARRTDGKTICDENLSQCVECIGTNDCRPTEACVAKMCRPACKSDNQCTPLGLLCDVVAGVCVQCLSNQDCTNGERCLAGVCSPVGPVNGNGGAPGTGGSFHGTGGILLGSGGDVTFGTGGTPELPDASCNAVTVRAEGVVVQRDASFVDTVITYSPVALYVMLDRSGSMVTGIGGDAQSWNNSTTALESFLNDPQSAGLDVGLGFFPPLSGSAMCDGSDCGTPAVEIAPTSQVLGPITSALNNGVPQPTNLTPTECGIRGMIAHCQAYTATSSAEPCVTVLVTDGSPTACDTIALDLVNIVADGRTRGVLTFVLGLPGSSLTFLNPLAAAGGTNAAIDVSGGSAAFISALNAIRADVARTSTHRVVTPGTIATTLPCEWKIPAFPSGQRVDPNQLNIQVTPAAGASPRVIGRATTAAACSGDGWYYDNPANPTQILACPSTCDMLKALNGPKVDLLLGCATVPAH